LSGKRQWCLVDARSEDGLGIAASDRVIPVDVASDLPLRIESDGPVELLQNQRRIQGADGLVTTARLLRRDLPRPGAQAGEAEIAIAIGLGRLGRGSG